MSLIKNLALLMVSLLFSYLLLVIGDLYIFRVISDVAGPLTDSDSITKASDIENKRRLEEDIPQRKRALKDGFTPFIYPSFMDGLSIEFPMFAGLPSTDTYLCNEGYGLIRYRSDRFGFRNKDENWDFSPKAIIIGDSFVHGACVSEDDTLSAQLSEIYGEVVLNLGVSDTHSTHYRTYAELFVPKLKPSNLFLVFYANDFGIFRKSAIEKAYVDDRLDPFSSDKLMLFDEEVFIATGTQVLKEVLGTTNKDESKSPKNLIHRIILAVIRHAKLPVINSLLISDEKQFVETENAIKSVNNLCNVYKCALTVVFIPNSKFFRPDPRADRYGELIKNLSNSLMIKFVDGRNVIDRSSSSPDFAIRGAHLSPVGLKKLSNYIFQVDQDSHLDNALIPRKR